MGGGGPGGPWSLSKKVKYSGRGEKEILFLEWT